METNDEASLKYESIFKLGNTAQIYNKVPKLPAVLTSKRPVTATPPNNININNNNHKSIAFCRHRSKCLPY